MINFKDLACKLFNYVFGETFEYLPPIGCLYKNNMTKDERHIMRKFVLGKQEFKNQAEFIFKKYPKEDSPEWNYMEEKYSKVPDLTMMKLYKAQLENKLAVEFMSKGVKK